MTKRPTALLSLVVMATLVGCGPATMTRTRVVFDAYSPADSRQTKDGVVAELKFTREYPPSFTATVQRCDAAGRLVVGSLGQPATERVSLARPGQMWEQVALTNHTDHVLRLNSVVIRLFDPSGSQIEPLTWADIQVELMAVRPCQSTALAVQLFRVNKVFDRNMEIVPGSTSTFWLAFRPPSALMTGTWRYAVYEVPVRVDSTGRPTKTTQFDMRVTAKQVVDTLHRENLLAPVTLVSSKEVSEGGSTTSTNSAPAPSSQPAPAPTARVARDAAPAPAAKSSPPANSAPEAQQPLNKELISRAQVRLKELGFDPGGTDGRIGPRSTAAIKRFQTARKLPSNGELTPGTLDALGLAKQ